MFAARVSDMHICPMFTGPVPHVGGPILPPGALPNRVLIGKLPAARMLDMCLCIGPPDMITSNCATNVMIGGMFAARMGSITAHGGVVVLGCFTVLMGSGAGSAAAAAQIAASAAADAASAALEIASSAAEAVSELGANIAELERQLNEGGLSNEQREALEQELAEEEAKREQAREML